MDCLINTKTDVFARNKIRSRIPFSQLSRIDARPDLQPFFMIVIYIIAITFLGPFLEDIFGSSRKLVLAFLQDYFVEGKVLSNAKGVISPQRNKRKGLQKRQ